MSSNHSVPGPSGHGHGGFRAKLAHGVQNPAHLHRRIGRGAGDGVEDGRKRLLLPQNHAGRKCDLGVPHVLRVQPFQQPARDQGIIGRRAQQLAHRAEGFQKGVEIGILVERAKGGNIGRRIEFMEGFGLDRAFQVQM